MSEAKARPWQPVMAALADGHVLQVYAARVPGLSAGVGAVFGSPKDLQRLVTVGLLDAATLEPIPGAFASVLEANRTPKP